MATVLFSPRDTTCEKPASLQNIVLRVNFPKCLRFKNSKIAFTFQIQFWNFYKSNSLSALQNLFYKIYILFNPPCTKLKNFLPIPSGVLWYPKDYFLKSRIWQILFYIEICVYLYLNCYCIYKHRIFGILGHFNDNVGHFWKTSASPHVRMQTDTTTSTTTLISPPSPKHFLYVMFILQNFIINCILNYKNLENSSPKLFEFYCNDKSIKFRRCLIVKRFVFFFQ